MPEKAPSPRAKALGARLREIRSRRFRYGTELARALGWDQPRVSKLERGTQEPTRADIEAWLEASEAPDGTLDELLEMLAESRVRYTQYSQAWATPGGAAALQDEYAEIDARSTRIVEFQPAIIPGLVQTPAYARAVLATSGPNLLGATAEEIEAKVNAQDRRQRVLYVPGKRIQIGIGQAALTNVFGSPDVLAGQLDRLTVVSQFPTVEVGILPFGRSWPIQPLAGFAINDDARAWVETPAGEQELPPDDVAAYVQMFEAFWAAASRGSEALALIRSSRGC